MKTFQKCLMHESSDLPDMAKLDSAYFADAQCLFYQNDKSHRSYYTTEKKRTINIAKILRYLFW